MRGAKGLEAEGAAEAFDNIPQLQQRGQKCDKEFPEVADSVDRGFDEENKFAIHHQ